MAEYTLVKLLGKGGFGVVYLIKDTKSDEVLALKTVDLDKASDDEKAFAEKEAKLMRGLEHSHVVQYVDSYFKGTTLFIFAEFCDGGDLHQFLNDSVSRIPEDLVVCWMTQVLFALEYLHARNILHRDLKPKNIFLTRQAHAKLGDLGIARVLAQPADMASTLIGTPCYMSPEILLQEGYNQKADIWSLGCVLFEITSGRRAIDEVSPHLLVFKVLAAGIPPIDKLYSKNLRIAGSKMVDKRQEKRPSTSELLSSSPFSDFIKKPKEPLSIMKETVFVTKWGTDQSVSNVRKLIEGLFLGMAPLGKITISKDSLAHYRKRKQKGSHVQPCAVDAVASSAVSPPPPVAVNQDKWDNYHVKMPCSPRNEYFDDDKGSSSSFRRRWDLIHETLNKSFAGIDDLEKAINIINKANAVRSRFTSLRHYLTDCITEKDLEEFLTTTLPNIRGLALALPTLFHEPIPLLKQGSKKSITLTQHQVACLLANAFFCTFPRRNSQEPQKEFCNYPDINFNGLFQDQSKRRDEKIRCILHYFMRVTQQMPQGKVTYRRQVIDRFPKWEELQTGLSKLTSSSDGTIEDSGQGMLQVLFANNHIGGSLYESFVGQQQARLFMCPEMIIARLFTESLREDECLFMTGCEVFSMCAGLGDTFTWIGDRQDMTTRDEDGHRQTQIVAIDPLHIKNYKAQFQKDCLIRELNKAYTGFFNGDVPPAQLPWVVTGNWGCGASGGDKRLKALIQMLAASAAQRHLSFKTAGDDEFRDELLEIHRYLSNRDFTVGQIVQLIHGYHQEIINQKRFRPRTNVFQFIMSSKD
ncbi:poly(ADP-ribose) glycohydrolase-like [Haliotis cracherodii]|uniref:poly(ADP-ribose) glycohydrolase-like n=1 Tax=Haliotis cracherodii TaxID=6455 RepID=UPI0039EA10A3